MIKNKIKVLVVDDSKLIRELVYYYLNEQSGIEAIGQCEDGDEVCDFLVEKKADIVLMDINMKRMDGIESTQEVVKNFPDIKVVAYSMHDSEEMKNKMYDAGASLFFTKSTNLKLLADAIYDLSSSINC